MEESKWAKCHSWAHILQKFEIQFKASFWKFVSCIKVAEGVGGSGSWWVGGFFYTHPRSFRCSIDLQHFLFCSPDCCSIRICWSKQKQKTKTKLTTSGHVHPCGFFFRWEHGSVRFPGNQQFLSKMKEAGRKALLPHLPTFCLSESL